MATGNIKQQPSLVVENSEALRWLILNRAEQMNALNTDLASAFIEALQLAEKAPEVKVVAITGSGNAFCSGADLIEFQNAIDNNKAGSDFLDKMTLLHGKLRTISKPTIAAVNGLACAGGLELVLCCDLVVALDSAKLGDAHANYAAFPGGGGAALLPRRIGLNRAKYLLYTGELFPARVWHSWGVVAELAADQQILRDKTEALAAKLSDKSPLVLKEMKRIADMTENEPADLCLQEEINTLKNLCASDDLREGFSAFKEKRRPRFTGK